MKSLTILILTILLSNISMAHGGHEHDLNMPEPLTKWDTSPVLLGNALWPQALKQLRSMEDIQTFEDIHLHHPETQDAETKASTHYAFITEAKALKLTTVFLTFQGKSKIPVAQIQGKDYKPRVTIIKVPDGSP